MKVLIVEDNVLVAMMLEEELRLENHSVIGPVASAEEARELPELDTADGIDCAFVDIDLTDGRTGGDLARILKQQGDVPVVFVTGQRDLADLYSSHAVGALTKPIDPDTFIATVAALAALKDGQAPRWPTALRRYQ